MVLGRSEFIWRNIEKLDKEEQRKLLQWQLQAREPIHRFADIRACDHLVVKRSFLAGLISYEHHFLCIGFDGQKPKIIHYHNTSRNAAWQLIPTLLESGCALEDLGIVQEMTLPHKDFIDSEEDLQERRIQVERVVWPEEMVRYSKTKVIERATKWKGRKWYNVVKNNCETFVMWCLCDLAISTQVTRSIHVLCEVGSSLVHTIRQALQHILKGLVDLAKVRIDYLDDILAQISPNFAENIDPQGAGLALGTLVSILVEFCIACRDICDAKEKWDEGVLIKTKTEFIKAVIDSVVSAPIHVLGNVGGMLFGQIICPIPLVGGLLGAVVGYILGRCSAKLLTEFEFTESLADSIADCIQRIEDRPVHKKTK